MKKKIQLCAVMVMFACSLLFIGEKFGFEIPVSATAKDTPSCKLVLGMTKDEGRIEFEKEITEKYMQGYRVVGFSSIKQEGPGFYVQALMLKE